MSSYTDLKDATKKADAEGQRVLTNAIVNGFQKQAHLPESIDAGYVLFPLGLDGTRESVAEEVVRRLGDPADRSIDLQGFAISVVPFIAGTFKVKISWR